MSAQEGDSDVNHVMLFVRDKWVELKRASRFHFSDRVDEKGNIQKGLFEFKGVYVIYHNEEPIYVGSAGKGGHVLRYRLMDLFAYSPHAKRNHYYHTLTKKLVKNGDFHDRFAVWKFYRKSCTFKVIETENMDQARLLEQAFMVLYRHPKYNAQ